MEIYRSSEEIQERFADAAAALVMDRYVTEMQKNTKEEPLPEIPMALDQKCRKLIKKRLMKKQCKDISKKILHYAKTAAIAIVMLFGIGGILFTTVEAVRVPIINFFIEHRDGYLEIGGQDADGNRYVDASVAQMDHFLSELLPEGYRLEEYKRNSTGSVSILCTNSLDEYIIFCISPYTGTFHVDTEDVTVENIKLSKCEALLTNKGWYQLTWVDDTNGKLLQLEATALSREEIIALAEKIEKNR